MQDEQSKIISYQAGKRLVVLQGDDVREFLAQERGSRTVVVESNPSGEAAEPLFQGSEEETDAILEGLHEAFAGPTKTRESHRMALMGGVGALVIGALIGFGASEYRTSSLKDAALNEARLQIHQMRAASRAAATPADPASVAAPTQVAGENPETDGPDETPAGGNALPPGTVSPHGSTGEGVVKALKAAQNPTASKAPDLGRMPGLPAPKVAAGGAVKPPNAAPGAPAVPTSPQVAQAGSSIDTHSGQATAPSEASKGDRTASLTVPSTPASPSSGKDASTTPAASASAAPAPGQSKLTDALAELTKEAQARGDKAGEDARMTLAKKGVDETKKELDQLQSASAALSAGDKLTPELVRTLPHDLAEKLKEAGAVESPEETAQRLNGTASGKKTYTIVRIPPDALEKNMDKDGVPTIPDGNSWAATGGNVILPLPGGGEIRKPTDFAMFHLDM